MLPIHKYFRHFCVCACVRAMHTPKGHILFSQIDYRRKILRSVQKERGAFAWVGSALQFQENMKIAMKSEGWNTYKINPWLVIPNNHKGAILCNFPSIAFHLQRSRALDTAK